MKDKQIKRLIFATQNENKVKEIQELLPTYFSIKTLSDFNFSEEIPETQSDLRGNALQKAQFIYEKFQENCFADDTGLEVEALNGEPGVYSARYAGHDKNDDKNIELLLKNMLGEENRSAQFKTVIALIYNGQEYIFEGKINGEITTSRKGDEGFGYDSVFIPENKNKTFAEMSLHEKNQHSHRSKAFQLLSQFLEGK